jgi:PilZ domain-containing protein
VRLRRAAKLALEGRVAAIVSTEAGKEITIPMQAGHYEEMQSAPRFPLHLSASVKGQSGALSAETQNISANGVLFAMDNDVPVGSMVDFTILLPGDVVGSKRNVQIDCRGRVIRSFDDRGRRGVGVVIDEYRFERT